MAGAPSQGWATAAGLLPLPLRAPVAAADVADRIAIAELFARYGLCHDEVDAEGFGDCFTEAGVLDVSLAGPVFDRHVGRAAIRENLIRVAATQTDQRRHAVTNIEMTPTGQFSATARAYGVVTGADATGVRVVVSCAYTADLAREAGGLWRFARLWIGMDHYSGTAPNHAPQQHTKERDRDEPQL